MANEEPTAKKLEPVLLAGGNPQIAKADGDAPVQAAMASVERHTVELSRNLGLFDATMIGVGAMIGAGIFVLTGLAINRAGPAALLPFGLNGVVTAFTALSYAELASSIPEAGGGSTTVRA
jgi:amino acid permease